MSALNAFLHGGMSTLDEDPRFCACGWPLPKVAIPVRTRRGPMGGVIPPTLPEIERSRALDAYVALPCPQCGKGHVLHTAESAVHAGLVESDLRAFPTTAEVVEERKSEILWDQCLMPHSALHPTEVCGKVLTRWPDESWRCVDGHYNAESTLRRETFGRMVREVWVAWARDQETQKPHHLLPWEELSEGDQEVDRRIGETLRGVRDWRVGQRATMPPADMIARHVVVRKNIVVNNKSFMETAWPTRRPGATGIVLAYSNSHGLAFKVEHEDGAIAYYDDYEIELADFAALRQG